MTLRQITGILLLGALSSCLIVSAQQTPSRIVTKTRLQVVFADLETQWLKAVQAKNKVVVKKLLSDSFEVWTPTQVGPIPLDNWTERAFAHPPKTFDIRQIAVRAVSDDVSVVSFVLNETFAGKPSSDNKFVVDVWKKDGDAWRCTDRYLSDATQGHAAPEDVRPDGKQ
jgi:hypothetical protein